MQVTITKMNNGFVLEAVDSEGEPEVCEVYEGYRDALARLLREAVEYLGEGGSRYDPDRIHIDLRPGDKYSEPLRSGGVIRDS